jgi:epsin
MRKLIIAACILASVPLAGCVYHPYRYGYYGDRYDGDRYDGRYYDRDRADGYYGGYSNDRYGYRRGDGYYGTDERYYRDYDR